MFLNGTLEKSDTTLYDDSYSGGDGQLVVGRLFTNSDKYYSSVDLDELYFFNTSLTQDQI